MSRPRGLTPARSRRCCRLRGGCCRTGLRSWSPIGRRWSPWRIGLSNFVMGGLGDPPPRSRIVTTADSTASRRERCLDPALPSVFLASYRGGGGGLGGVPVMPQRAGHTRPSPARQTYTRRNPEMTNTNDFAGSSVQRPAAWGVSTRDLLRLLRAALLGAGAELAALFLMAIAAWLLLRAAERPALGALSLAIVAVRALALLRGGLRYAERLA